MSPGDRLRAARDRAAVEAHVAHLLDERADEIDAAYRKWRDERAAARLHRLFGAPATAGGTS